MPRRRVAFRHGAASSRRSRREFIAMSQVSVVTGANSGIGRATAVHLAQQGHRVFGTVRALAKAEKLNAMAKQAGVEVELVPMDVASDDSVRDGMREILERAGRVDNLVNNAGVGGNAVAEECPVSLYHDVMNVNLYGAVRCIHAVLPGMRARRSGTIVNVSSVVGRVAAIGQQPYFTSKWALEGMSEGLAQELAPFGIRVAIVEPGITKSAIFAKNTDGPNATGAYDAHYRRLFQFYAVGIAQATDPFEVGAVVHEAITTRTPRLRYAVSWGAEEMIAGRRRMSDEQWVAMGALASDADYYDAFERYFGVRIHP
jgi:NAD(P)-dependent dehydrogenase (short-subunit alcohol dehydrogenase family)